MRTALGLVGAASAFVGLLCLAEATTRRWAMRPELGRKLAHMSSGVTAAALPLVIPFPAIVGLSAAFIPFMIVSRRLHLFPLIQSVERSTLGEIYFPVGVLVAAALVPHRVEYAFGVLVMGLGDAVASLSGQRYGRRTYRVFMATKTYLGSGALLATTLTLCLGALGVLGSLDGPALLVAAAIAGAVTLEEALVGGGADNVVLPISAAALLRSLT